MLAVGAEGNEKCDKLHTRVTRTGVEVPNMLASTYLTWRIRSESNVLAGLKGMNEKPKSFVPRWQFL